MKNTYGAIGVVLLVCSWLIAGCSNFQGNQAVAPDQQVQQSQPHVSWSGDIDDSATVFVQSGQAWVDDVTGKPVQNATTVFQGTLPANDGTTVKLASKVGRGTVAVVQQPTKDNNYTAGVRILDPEPGAGHYNFVLTW